MVVVPAKAEVEVPPVLVGSPRAPPVDETAAEAADMAAAMVLGDAGGTLSSGTIEYGWSLAPAEIEDSSEVAPGTRFVDAAKLPSNP